MMSIQMRPLRRALALWLTAALALMPALGMAEGGDAAPEDVEVLLAEADDGEAPAEDEAPDDAASDEAGASADPDAVKYVAVATVGLKLRRTAEKINNGIGSIKRGETVYVVELGAEWSRVKDHDRVGFVQTQYLSDIRAFNPSTEEAGEIIEAPVFDTAAPEDNNGFQNNFQAHAVKATALYTEPNRDAKRVCAVKIYRKVTVSENSNGWSYCKLENSYGYVPTEDLYKWDRINAYAGPIPGQIVYKYVAFVKRTANVYSLIDNDILNTYPINPGTAICVEEKDAQGRYPTMYWRERAYLNADDVASTIPVADWNDAQSGDLISVMTTFFAVGVSTLNYQGRNWNIYLAANKITGTILQPGEEYNQNKTIGPYSKSTGYKSAPIMNPTKLTGYGGGTCQVNTTFYITTVAVPLLVTHRRVHCDVGMKYCLKGFDAAVGGGDINLQMVNTLPYAIRYHFFVSDGVMTCCIFRES